ncbi:MAG: hypothetical protein JWL58_7166 [Streptosporangiaceae bacterium]|jgi:hypothetical protein|nr:hypothetical protein [Streptosporangiaceae bacterium]
MMEVDTVQRLPGGTTPVAAREASELKTADDVELVEELSLLTTQAGRMRARMAEIMAELDRRRMPAGSGSCLR